MSDPRMFPNARKIAGEHLQRMTIHITRYHPDHEDREATTLYRHTRAHLIDDLKLGCWICGTREHLECHHWYVEWADQNAVDWAKFKERHPNVVPWRELRHPQEFVDRPENMRILCARHHRHINHGVHCLTLSDWFLQAWDLETFVFAPPRTRAGMRRAA